MGRPTRRFILLSFDVEEFDTPSEYGQDLSGTDQVKVSAEGLDRVMDLLGRMGVRATLFTTAHYALHQPEQIRSVAAGHEVASHGFAHGSFTEQDPSRSKAVLEELAGARVCGFRRPRMQETDKSLLRGAGYTYDSSEHPTWIPGRYNNFFKRRTAYLADGLLTIPASVTPLIRFPLFWLSFKNFPLAVIQRASSRVLEADGYLNVYYHSWEFADLRPFRLPGYIRRIDGAALLDRLDRYVRWLKDRGEFVTCAEFEAWFRRATGRRGDQ
jgi:peptidoglycan/xylan/chitin deacetylase (PgdA/CDA1 family)